MKELYTSCYPIQDVIYIPSCCMVSLLCCGGCLSNVILIDAKIKYRSPYLFCECSRDVLFRVGSIPTDLI